MHRITKQQVRKLMDELTKDGNVSRAAMKAGMSRPTARKYRDGPVPEIKERTWRTRENPFEPDWAEMERMLKLAPELEGKALFEFLMKRNLSQIGQLRQDGREEEAAAKPDQVARGLYSPFDPIPVASAADNQVSTH